MCVCVCVYVRSIFKNITSIYICQYDSLKNIYVCLLLYIYIYIYIYV